MTEEITVRLATWQDEQAIMDMTRLIHGEIGRHDYCEEKVRAVVHKALNKELAMIGVIGEPGKVGASLYLNWDSLWYSNAWQLHELWNFVHPDYRRTDYGSRLIKWSKSISDQIMLDLFIGIFNNVRTEAKTRMYERLLPKAGAFFLYQPDKLVEPGS